MAEPPTAETEALRDAIGAAIDTRGYPWLVGVLEGAIRHGWTPGRVAEFINERSNPSASTDGGDR